MKSESEFGFSVAYSTIIHVLVIALIAYLLTMKRDEKSLALPKSAGAAATPPVDWQEPTLEERPRTGTDAHDRSGQEVGCRRRGQQIAGGGRRAADTEVGDPHAEHRPHRNGDVAEADLAPQERLRTLLDDLPDSLCC